MTHLQPQREYTDWHRFTPRRFVRRHYGGPSDWEYYYNIDWESFLTYTVILNDKGYNVVGEVPHWLNTYWEEMRVVPFESGGSDITLVFHKPGWVKNTLTYHLTDKVAPDNFVYNVTSRIEAEEDFLKGKEAAGCPQRVWQPYALRRIENLRNGNLWEPTKK